MTAEKKSQATALVELAHENFKFVCSTAGDVVALRRGGPKVCLPLRGNGSVRSVLAAHYMETAGRAPSATALADALVVLEGRAHGTEPVDLHLRVAPSPSFVTDGVVIDMGTADGSAITITPEGWWIGTDHGVLFRRTGLTSPMLVPVRDGDLGDLRRLLNVSDASWPLLVAWMVAALIPDIAHPILSLIGEQGTGKSAGARKLAQILDPSPAPLRTAPRDVEQWAVAASGSSVVAVDNVSTITAWFSDALCRAVTGDGMVRRALYTDSGVSVLSFKRTIILTTIDAGALRGDLAERLVLIELERIDPSRRRSDTDLDGAYNATAPGALGALLTLLSRVLEVLPKIHLDTLPRMADFARVCAAVDEVTGLDALPRYLGLGADLAAEVVDGDAVAVAVRDWFSSRTGPWEGTVSALLTLLKPDDPPKGWPSSARSLSGHLRRVAPALRDVGVNIEFTKLSGGTRTRLVCITRGDPKPTVPTVPTVPAGSSPGETPGTVPDLDRPDRPGLRPDRPDEHAGGDGRDAGDGPIRDVSPDDVIDTDEYEARYDDLFGEVAT